MPTCPKCLKQELKSGEKLCPHCSNKRTSFWAKVAQGALAVGLLGVVVVGSVLLGNSKKPKA